MPKPELDLTAFHNEEAAVAGRVSDAKARQAQLAQMRAQLIQAIKNGQTTGDHLFDYAFTVGEEHTDLATRLRHLESQLALHQGEFVLVVEREEQLRPGCYGMGHTPSRRDYEAVERLYLGVIKGDKLTFHYRGPFIEASLPCSAGGWTSGFMRNVSLKHLDEPIKLLHAPRHPGYTKRLEIVVGDKAVTGWFHDPQADWRDPEWLKTSAEQLGRKVPWFPSSPTS